MPTASIIITNWNGKKWLTGCLTALAAQTFTDFEIILVDDGSSDGSAAWVRAHFPTVTVIEQAEHLGFAGANNLGIRQATGQYIVTLNNDTHPEPTWLGALIAGVDAPDVGTVAALTLVWDTPTLVDSAGIAVDWAGFGWNRGWRESVAAHETPLDIFGPCAAAALYRKSMLDDIGLFDEDYYTYYEDVDLAWRAQRAGWQCRYVPTARVLHHHSATGGRASPRKIYLLSRNKLWTLVKNYRALDFLWAWPLILVTDAMSAVYQLVRTRTLAPLRGRWDALRAIPKMWAKRSPAVGSVKLIPFWRR